MTVMQKAFEVAGLRPEDVVLDKAIALYLNSGGTIERAQARLNAAAARMPGVDQQLGAQGSQMAAVQPRQPVEDGEASSGVPQGQAGFASPSSSNSVGIDHIARAQKGLSTAVDSSANPIRGGRDQQTGAHERQPSRVPPVREPTQQQRSVAASVAKVLAVTVLDTLKIDGRAIGDWTIGEARAAGRFKTREGAILIEASRVVANAPSNALIRNVVKPAELQRIMQAAAETADAF